MGHVPSSRQSIPMVIPSTPPHPRAPPSDTINAGSGWIVSEERWEQRLDGLNLNTSKLHQGAEFAAALTARPDLKLDEVRSKGYPWVGT